MADSDAVLLKAAKRGNAPAFTALYERHRAPLFRFGWRMTGSTAAAEDIAHDCFVALLERGDFHPERGSLRAYLFGIARNRAFDRVRASQRENDQAQDAVAASNPLDDVLSVERSQAVGRAVATLPELQREALVLFEYEELSLEEIAGIAGVEVGAVKSRLSRARENLRQRLAPLLARPAEGRS